MSQPITFGTTIDGTNALTLSSGGGDILFNGPIGSTTRIGALNITSANNLTTQGITATSILQSAGTGTTTLNGVLNTSGVAGINLTLNNFSRNGAIITTNGGPFILSNSGNVTLVSPSNTSISGAFQQTGGLGAVSLSGTLTTTNQAIQFTSPITLTGSTLLNNGSGSGNINLASVTGANNLTLQAGAGNIVTGAIGSPTPLTNVTFTSATNITTSSIAAGTIIQSAGSGTSQFGGVLTTSAGGGITLSGASFQFPSNISTTTTGSFALTSSGTTSFGPGSTLSIDGSFSETGATSVSLGSAIITNNGAISFGSPVLLSGTTLIDSSAGNGNILFGSNLDGAADLSLTAGIGNITVSGAIGASTPLSSFTTSNTNNVTVANIGTFSQPGVVGALNIQAASVINLNGTTYHLDAETLTAPTVNFNGGTSTTVNSSGHAIAFNATTVELGAGTDLTINSGNGNITLSPLRAATNSGRNVTLNAGSGTITTSRRNRGALNDGEFATLALNGSNFHINGNLFTNNLSLTSTTGSVISLGGNITTVNSPISFPVAVTIGVPSVTLTSGGGLISFSNSVDGDTALTRNLVLLAGLGNIQFSGAVGSSQPLASLTIIRSDANVALSC